jgi:membrane associated rhomboid family serine protease
MLPLKAENRAQIIPYASLGLAGLNLAVWLYQQLLPRVAERLFIVKYGVVPGFVTGFSDVQLPAEWFPRLFTLVSFQFLHADALHLAGNLLYLWIFGNNIEAALGRVRYLGFYLLGGVVAGLCQVAAGPSSLTPMIGASGSIAAVLGAYLVLYPHARIVVLIWFFFFVQLVRVPALLLLGAWFLLQVLSVGQEGTAWMAHLGGFVAGLVLVRFFLPRPLVLH